jgi:hypothetical protein
MKLLKSAVIALTLALSLGSFSTTAVACEDGRLCFGNEEAVNLVLGKIAEAMKTIKDGGDEKEIITLIKQAKAYTKEINSEAVDRKKQKVTKHFLKARKAVKKGDMVEATAHLEKAEIGFEGFKKLF